MVDVRDMLCAQALARVAEAFKRVPAGEALSILGNTEDVERDVRVWAQTHGRIIEVDGAEEGWEVRVIKPTHG